MQTIPSLPFLYYELNLHHCLLMMDVEDVVIVVHMGQPPRISWDLCPLQDCFLAVDTYSHSIMPCWSPW